MIIICTCSVRVLLRYYPVPAAAPDQGVQDPALEPPLRGVRRVRGEVEQLLARGLKPLHHLVPAASPGSRHHQEPVARHPPQTGQ